LWKIKAAINRFKLLRWTALTSMKLFLMASFFLR